MKVELIKYRCNDCKDIGWIEEIKYTGRTIETLETGRIFLGYDRFYRATMSLSKTISGLEGMPLFTAMADFGNELNQLNKHNSKAVRCHCKVF